MRRLGAMILVATVTMVAPPLAAGRSRPGTPVPRGFVGMTVDGPMFTSQGGLALPDQFDKMRSSGVQSIHALFSWSLAQPYATSADIPASQQGAFVAGAGGIPTTFAGTDQIVTAAASRGITVLPIVMYTPSWAAVPRSGTGLLLPRDNRLYGEYLTTLIGRYGPRGSFWSQHPSLPRRPIRMWQVWNEPDLGYFWANQPFARTYVALLGVARAAIKRADPHASVVLGGLTSYAWLDLKSIYRVRGARRLFDLVDVHPYTRYPAGVVRILGFARATMDRAGDRGKPIIAGETGWPSSLHKTGHIYDFETTETGQSRNLRVLLPQLAANRRALRLIGFYWYTWMGDESPGALPFNFSGLLAFQNGQVRAKPALNAFGQMARALER